MCVCVYVCVCVQFPCQLLVRWLWTMLSTDCSVRAWTASISHRNPNLLLLQLGWANRPLATCLWMYFSVFLSFFLLCLSSMPLVFLVTWSVAARWTLLCQPMEEEISQWLLMSWMSCSKDSLALEMWTMGKQRLLIKLLKNSLSCWELKVLPSHPQ